MTELRWHRRVIGKKYDQHDQHTFNDETRDVLQYRYKYDATIYAGMGPFDPALRNMVWSEWKDVPVVHTGT